MQERRKYFRIDDAALVKYRVIQEDVLEEERRLLFLNYVKRENARDVLLGIDARFNELIIDFKRENQDMAELVDLINRKLSLIERMINVDDPDSPISDYPEHDMREVNLSGSGIAIVANAPIAAGAHLETDLILLPSYYHIKTYGKVVHCRAAEVHNHYAIAADFEYIRDEDQDRLIQHVLRKQSEQLKGQREDSVGTDAVTQAVKP